MCLLALTVRGVSLDFLKELSRKGKLKQGLTNEWR